MRIHLNKPRLLKQNPSDSTPPRYTVSGVGEITPSAIDYFFAALAQAYPSPPSPPPVFSQSLVRGWAGVLRLAQLESAGIQDHIRAGLPTVAAAFHRITEICTFLGPAARDRDIDAFVDQVIDVTSEFFSLEGRSILGADILVASKEPDLELELLAQMLWDTRSTGNL